MPLKIDLHVHTRYSVDAFITPKELSIYAKKRDLDGVAITDHDTIRGLPVFRKIKNLLIIPGLEVTTKRGHVLALNIDKSVKAGQSFSETIDQIHDNNGLAVIAHPTAFLKGISAEHLHPNFDAMEVINASAVPFSYSVRKNRKLAEELNLPQTGGSDAHCASEIGMAYTCMDADKDVCEIIAKIKKGAVTPFGKAIPWGMRLGREFRSIEEKLKDFKTRSFLIGINRNL